MQLRESPVDSRLTVTLSYGRCNSKVNKRCEMDVIFITSQLVSDHRIDHRYIHPDMPLFGHTRLCHIDEMSVDVMYVYIYIKASNCTSGFLCDQIHMAVGKYSGRQVNITGGDRDDSAQKSFVSISPQSGSSLECKKHLCSSLPLQDTNFLRSIVKSLIETIVR